MIPHLIVAICVWLSGMFFTGVLAFLFDDSMGQREGMMAGLISLFFFNVAVWAFLN